MENRFVEIRKKTGKSGNLIHSITSPIAINDCANVVLGLGAKPIMAEHPEEVEEITAISKALTVSYANITDARRKSIMLSGKKALSMNLPCAMDAVGVTCSQMRMREAKDFIEQCHPTVIKGNISEIKALAGMDFQNTGIDAGIKDVLKKDNRKTLMTFAEKVKAYAAKVDAIVVVTGEVDVIASGEKCCFVYNGSPYMASLTGTGCMLTCILGVYLSSCEREDLEQCFAAAVLSVLMMGIAGEKAAMDVIRLGKVKDTRIGMGSFHTAFLDALSLMDEEELAGQSDYELL